MNNIQAIDCTEILQKTDAQSFKIILITDKNRSGWTGADLWPADTTISGRNFVMSYSRSEIAGEYEKALAYVKHFVGAWGPSPFAGRLEIIPE